MEIPVHTDEYHRLREQAKQRALELRREAMRDAPAWLANAWRRWVGGALKRPSAHAPCSVPLTSRSAPPCPPPF